jgi:hypothetical protein
VITWRDGAAGGTCPVASVVITVVISGDGRGDPPAPVFGMVCKEHKNVAKAEIRKYREARREGTVTHATGAKPATPKKAKKAAPKVARARKLQGQYLGALKSLKGADRARVKGTAAEKSVAEAVNLAQSLKRAK